MREPARLIFGIHAVQSALRNDAAHVESVWIDSSRRDSRIRELIALAQSREVSVQFEDSAELARRAGGGRHQGVVACYHSAQSKSENALFALLDTFESPALLLVLDGVTDPHNLGACLRSAEAAGAQAVIAPKNRAAGLTPAAHKVASGAAERLPFVIVTNLARCLRRLQERGIIVIGADEEASRVLFDLDLTRPVALVLGAEGKGLRRLTRECCDWLAALPMAGQAESLNVSVAVGVCLFEAVRQRRG